jgi:dihydrodipicolinate synthase/N-acetylneuraminate lyase
LLVGSAAYLALAGPLGASGAILALANVEPERCAVAFAGDMAVQRELLDAHLRSLENFPQGLKAMLATESARSQAL